MSNIPSELKYAKSHEWVRDEGATVTVGITQHAQDLLGELVFVELPKVGKDVKAAAEVAVVESVKAASDVYSPISGKITAVNEDLINNPALVNEDPYGKGWLYKITPSDKSEMNALLSAEQYKAVESE